MLSPKKVHIPSDIVNDDITVMTAVKPRPNFERTSSILPNNNNNNNNNNNDNNNENGSGLPTENVMYRNTIE